MNLFFLVNRFLAKTMSPFDEYTVHITETHHIHKLDAPSGTAIKAAQGIIAEHGAYNKWVKGMASATGELAIHSERTGEVPGTHVVTYASPADTIELRHEALDRSGFAQGAVRAAEWVLGRKGIFTMDDLIKSLI